MMRDALPGRREKKGGDEEMEERQKIEKIKREQMGHEGVVNALA